MDEHKNNPGKKMRSLLAGGKLSPLTRLPKKGNADSFLPLNVETKAETSTKLKDVPSTKDISLKNKTTKEEAPHASRPPKLALPASKGMKLNIWPPFWTIASILSLTINLVLISILVVVTSAGILPTSVQPRLYHPSSQVPRERLDSILG